MNNNTTAIRYDKDKELIEKLWLNAEGKYQRFAQGDIEYLVLTITKCNKMETFLEQQGLMRKFENQ